MQIQRNPSIEQWALEEVQNNWGSDAHEGIHLSDLLAPRKAYFQRIMPIKPSIEEISYWTSGNAIEDKFLGAIGYKKGETKEWNGILYSPDTFFNFPAEIKSRRRALAQEGKEVEVYDYYLKQLKGYCAVENKQKGWLIIMSLAEKQDDNSTKPEWAYYDVMFTNDELIVERDRLLYTKEMLIASLVSKDHSHLPLCPEWMCGKVLKIMDAKPHCLTCKRDFETEWGINKHLDSKTGKGHDIRPATYKYDYLKRCKWFDYSQPFEGNELKGGGG